MVSARAAKACLATTALQRRKIGTNMLDAYRDRIGEVIGPILDIGGLFA
jgi:hypothetical protein